MLTIATLMIITGIRIDHQVKAGMNEGALEDSSAVLVDFNKVFNLLIAVVVVIQHHNHHQTIKAGCSGYA